jgi:hypothetical protein
VKDLRPSIERTCLRSQSAAEKTLRFGLASIPLRKIERLSLVLGEAEPSRLQFEADLEQLRADLARLRPAYRARRGCLRWGDPPSPIRHGRRKAPESRNISGGQPGLVSLRAS